MRFLGEVSKFEFAAWLTALAIGFALPVSHAEAETTAQCVRRSLNSVLYSGEFVSSKLSGVPELRRMILEIMDDPAVPRNIKTIIKRGLDNDTTVIDLTDSVRAEYKIPDNFEAGQLSTDQDFYFIGKEPGSPTQVGPGKTLNEQASEQVRQRAAPVTSRHIVFVQQRPISKDTNDLIALIHELSHVRFKVMIERYLGQMATSFPPQMIKPLGNGKFAINRQLYDFLTERYAYQTEYNVLKATHGRYFTEWYELYDFPGTLSDAEMTERISDSVIENYQITDPSILALRKKTISQILIGGSR